MAALFIGLSALTRFKTLRIYADFRTSYLNTNTIPTERAVLPALTDLSYDAVLEHCENFVARIDTPLIEYIELVFYSWHAIEFPQLCHFIRRTCQLGSPTHAEIRSSMCIPAVTLIHKPVTTCGTTSPGQLRLDVEFASN